MKGVFVTGTDTGVGKTLVSACLVRAWGADYWKPAQTGARDGDDDTATVRQLGELSPQRLHPPRVVLQEPASVERAAELENVRFDLADFTLPATPSPLVVEGAGGLLVPLNEQRTLADLVARLGLPLVVVARSTLGTINHTLLTLEAIRARELPLAGVILNGPPGPHNRDAIERHGRVRVLCEIPAVPSPGPADVARLASLIPPLESLT